ncbi:serine protease [Planktothrix sp. FACHB-1355]|uniref:Serine protease n=1 Tax=Aerosakkonema funiforme FACHB-1375 TaxID=2949571 RepID=A0A926VLU1_9CYAN|nr:MULTISPECIES: tetratricopeptide repeat-containing serine protease family protein [Oscillatoriales]MBD2186181.1 serine protease [Aerosakkonema funiforme FACHB-1375]MBD3562647.1 serine protease [Planktothrix sp. FACHB-1355]
MGKRLESFEAVQKSTVRVKDTAGKTWGTGFFVTNEGHLLTCAHVVEDAGGWKNVRVLDRPVTCIYEGDSESNDFSVLLVEDIPLSPAPLQADFEPGDEFLSPGFSNDDFYGAPIRGEITAFARCGKLGNQKLIRLETFSDAQRIEGGQSGAPIFVYKKGNYRAVGIIVASEDLNGGLAISISTVLKSGALAEALKVGNKITLRQLTIPTLIALMGGVSFLSVFGLKQTLENFDKCSRGRINSANNIISDEIASGNYESALFQVNKIINDCPNKDSLLITKGRIYLEKSQYTDAILLFQDALKIQETVEARYNLGLALAKSDDCAKALEEFKKIENDLKLKINIYYSMGVCYDRLENWKQALEKLRYVANNKQGNRKLYSDSLYYLTEINAKLWYLNQKSPEKLKFQNDFMKYLELQFNNLDPNKQVTYLEQTNKDIQQINKNPFEGTPEYSFIYSTQEFKKLICKLHKNINREVPSNLKKSC